MLIAFDKPKFISFAVPEYQTYAPMIFAPATKFLHSQVGILLAIKGYW